MRISDWSSDVCSSDLQKGRPFVEALLLVCTAAVIIGTAIFIASPLQSSAWILLSGYLVGSILLFGVYSTVIVSMQFIAPEGVRATLVACTTFIGSGLALDRKSTRLNSSH